MKIQRYLAPVFSCCVKMQFHFPAPGCPVYHQCLFCGVAGLPLPRLSPSIIYIVALKTENLIHQQKHISIGKLRFFLKQGEGFLFAFSNKTKSFRNDNGDWGYASNFEDIAGYSADRVGKNPLVIKIEGIAKNGDIVLGNEQLSVINKLTADPRNHLLGGVILR